MCKTNVIQGYQVVWKLTNRTSWKVIGDGEYLSKVASSANSQESVLGMTLLNGFISDLEGNIKWSLSAFAADTVGITVDWSWGLKEKNTARETLYFESPAAGEAELEKMVALLTV